MAVPRLSGAAVPAARASSDWPGQRATGLAARPALTDSGSSLAHLGATLGATRMNDVVVPRTDVNSEQRQARGRGLI